MTPCIAEPRKEVGKYAPKIVQIMIDPAKIGDVVGQRGKTINTIIERTGVKIILKGLEAPLYQIAANAGVDGSVVVDKIKNSKKKGWGYDAYTETYCDMVASGIVDPTRVTRSALQNAASIAATILTTESVVADIKEPAPAAPAAGAGMDGMY